MSEQAGRLIIKWWPVLLVLGTILVSGAVGLSTVRAQSAKLDTHDTAIRDLQISEARSTSKNDTDHTYIREGMERMERTQKDQQKEQKDWQERIERKLDRLAK